MLVEFTYSWKYDEQSINLQNNVSWHLLKFEVHYFTNRNSGLNMHYSKQYYILSWLNQRVTCNSCNSAFVALVSSNLDVAFFSPHWSPTVKKKEKEWVSNCCTLSSLFKSYWFLLFVKNSIHLYNDPDSQTLYFLNLLITQTKSCFPPSVVVHRGE